MSEQIQTCNVCGTELEEYDIYDKETGQIVDTNFDCPNEWRVAHYNMKQEKRRP